MKVSDILDRWCILKMKARYDECAKKELVLFDAEAGKIFRGSNDGGMELISLVLDLMEANAKTWENEAAIRKEYDKDASSILELDLSEIGRRAMVIRGHNKQRVEAKAKIDAIFGQIPDKKVEHASQ